MNKEKINYFIYLRKSTEGDSRQVLSIDGQLEDLQKIISREGLTVIDTISEKRSAATPFNRPEYSEMITRIKKGEASGIIVWHIDRLARNHLEAGELQYLLQIGVIKSVWTVNREYKSQDNALLYSLEASVATQYSRDLSEKVRRGLQQKCTLGQPPGIAKLGYLNTKFAAHGTNRIIEDPERWHIVRKGFELMLSRKNNVPQIADILNNEYGLRTRRLGERGGSPIGRSALHRIFTDPFYSGYFNYSGKLHKGSYKPMITVEEFDQVQEILRRKLQARPKKHEFAFTGLIKCGVCGCAITASEKIKLVKKTGEYKSYIFYHCTKRKGCTDKHYTKLEEMEVMIEKELSDYWLDPDFRDWAVRILRENHQDEIDKHNELIVETALYEQKIERELDTLIDLRVGNNITEEKYLQKKEEKEAELIRVRGKKKQLEEGTDNWLTKLEERLDFAVNALARFQTKDIHEQKLICKHFGWNWVLRGKKLIIDKLEWFEHIKEYGNAVESQFGRLEPKKTFEKYGEKASLEILRPIVRRLQDHVVTKNSRKSGKAGLTSP